MVTRLALAAALGAGLAACTFTVTVPDGGFICSPACGSGLQCVNGNCVAPGGSGGTSGGSDLTPFLGTYFCTYDGTYTVTGMAQAMNPTYTANAVVEAGTSTDLLLTGLSAGAINSACSVTLDVAGSNTATYSPKNQVCEFTESSGNDQTNTGTGTLTVNGTGGATLTVNGLFTGVTPTQVDYSGIYQGTWSCARSAGTTSGGTSGGSTGGSTGTGTSGTSTGGTSSGGGSTGARVTPVAFVQGAQGIDYGGLNDPSLASSAFPLPVARGDLLIAAVTFNSDVSVIVSVTDTLGNVFQPLDTFGVGGSAGAAQGLATLYAANVDGGTGDVFTATFNPQTSDNAIFVAEYAGLDPANPVQTHQMVPAPNTTQPAVTLSSSSATALEWAFALDVGSGEPVPFTTNDGFTSRDPNDSLWYGGANYYGGVADLIVTDAGPQNPSWTVSVTDDFICTAVAFRAPDAGP